MTINWRGRPISEPPIRPVLIDRPAARRAYARFVDEMHDAVAEMVGSSPTSQGETMSAIRNVAYIEPGRYGYPMVSITFATSRQGRDGAEILALGEVNPSLGEIAYTETERPEGSHLPDARTLRLTIPEYDALLEAIRRAAPLSTIAPDRTTLDVLQDALSVERARVDKVLRVIVEPQYVGPGLPTSAPAPR